MSAKVVGSLGLILDIIGVCILFKFAFPQPDLSEGVHLTWGKDASVGKRRRYYVARSFVGLACLTGGFALQLLAIWM